MAYQLAPGIHVAMIADQAIILDERADRYTKLAHGLSQTLRNCLDGSDDGAMADHVANLQRMGLIVPAHEPHGELRRVPPIVTHSIDAPIGRAGPLRTVATAVHLAAARRQLRLHGLASTLAQARRRAAKCQGRDDPHAAAIARAFRASRGWLPFARACLPDSLALHALMCQRSLRTTLVIGVRDYPFSAHCWLQSGSLVLTDPADAIEPLVPILVI